MEAAARTGRRRRARGVPSDAEFQDLFAETNLDPDRRPRRPRDRILSKRFLAYSSETANPEGRRLPRSDGERVLTSGGLHLIRSESRGRPRDRIKEIRGPILSEVRSPNCGSRAIVRGAVGRRSKRGI